jgi:hypothetical protein
LFHLLQLVLRKCFKELILVEIDDLAVRSATHTASPFDIEKEFLVAEKGPGFELPQTVLQTARRLEDFPRLVAYRKLAEIIYLYNGFHYHPA